VAQFPAAGGPLIVTGRFRLGINSEDRFAIVSRWDGVEQDVAFASNGSVPLRGLQIDLRPRTSPNPDPNGEAVFLEFNGDDGTFLGGNFDLLGSGLTLEAKGTHDFVFNDDGTNFSLTVTHVGGPGIHDATGLPGINRRTGSRRLRQRRGSGLLGRHCHRGRFGRR